MSPNLARRDLALAKLSLGSLTMAALATFAAQGYITGGGPTDPDLKQLKRQTSGTGWQPYSISVVTMPPRTIERIELTPQEYERFVVFSADGLKDTLRTLMQSEG